MNDERDPAGMDLSDRQPDEEPHDPTPSEPWQESAPGTQLRRVQLKRPATLQDERALRQGNDSEVLLFGQVVERMERPFLDERIRSDYWQRIRLLRTELQLRREGHAATADMIAIVSPGGGEGRSRLAADLAVSFAQTGARTLLVDADCRHPRQHELFGTRREMGLTEAIAAGQQAAFHSVGGVQAMYLLTAGTSTEDPLEGLSGDLLARLTEQWRRQFQVVIFDTPPAAQHPDALVVARLMSRALVVSRAHVTSSVQVSALVKRLKGIGVPICGAVLNRF